MPMGLVAGPALFQHTFLKLIMSKLVRLNSTYGFMGVSSRVPDEFIRQTSEDLFPTFTVTPTATTLQVDITPVAQLRHYEVAIGSLKNSITNIQETVDNGGLRYTYTDLDPGGTYYIYARSKYRDLTSIWSEPIVITTDVDILLEYPPDIVTELSDGVDDIQVSWTDQVDRINFDVIISTNPSDLSVFFTTTNVNYTVVDKPAGTYYTRVRTRFASGVSEWSPSQSIVIVPQVVLPTISWTATTKDVDEGGAIVVTAQRQGDLTLSSTATISLVGSTATLNTDYVINKTTLTWPSNQATATVTITAIDDRPITDDLETVVLTLGAGTNCQVNPSFRICTVTIHDRVTVVGTPQNVVVTNTASTITITWEPPIGDAPLGYTAYRSASTGAEDNAMYVAVGNSSITWTSVPAGTWYVFIAAEYLEGSGPYSAESVVVIGGTPITSFSVDTSSATEGITTVVDVVRGGSGLISPSSVNVAVSGTATFGTDYTLQANGGSIDTLPFILSFPSNITSSPITITSLSDAASDNGETIVFTLTANANTTLGSFPTHTHTITEITGLGPAASPEVTWPRPTLTNIGGTGVSRPVMTSADNTSQINVNSSRIRITGGGTVTISNRTLAQPIQFESTPTNLILNNCGTSDFGGGDGNYPWLYRVLCANSASYGSTIEANDCNFEGAQHIINLNGIVHAVFRRCTMHKAGGDIVKLERSAGYLRLEQCYLGHCADQYYYKDFITIGGPYYHMYTYPSTGQQIIHGDLIQAPDIGQTYANAIAYGKITPTITATIGGVSRQLYTPLFEVIGCSFDQVAPGRAPYRSQGGPVWETDFISERPNYGGLTGTIFVQGTSTPLYGTPAYPTCRIIGNWGVGCMSNGIDFTNQVGFGMDGAEIAYNDFALEYNNFPIRMQATPAVVLNNLWSPTGINMDTWINNGSGWPPAQGTT